jgi:hypothetical protein
MATNVPGLTLTDRGYVAPSEAAVLTGVQADMNAAFGGGLNQSLSTPQGQLASSMTSIIGNSNDTVVFQFNQFDPAIASGRAQDAIGRIYFIERNPAEPTVVQAVCTGGQGVVIPAGALARAQDGNVYTCTDGTGPLGIPVTGTVTLTFACNIAGPIPCPANALNFILQSIPGWDSINNPTDGVIGNDVESRQDFEFRRAASVAQNSRGSLPSVLGAVLNVDGVLDAYVTENVTNSTVTIGGASLVAHSLYVSAVGGTQADVAKAIWSKKAPGCNYNGNTTVVVQDLNSGYVAPYPSYNVTFEVPPSLPIMFNVALATNLQVPSDAVAQVQAAIMAAFAGADGGARARIGSTIYASRYYAPISALGSWVQIISIQIGSPNVPSASFTGSIAGTALTVTVVASGTIAIGQTVADSTGAILPGTKILSGSGLSWVLSKSQTVASEAMTGSLANNSLVSVNINQAPTISADNINVTVS